MEDKMIYRRVRFITLILMIVLSILATLILGKFEVYGVGIILGALVGIVNFNMVVKLSEKINVGNAQLKGTLNYYLRIILTGIVFALAMYKGVNVFALLIGYLLSKLAVYYEMIKGKKENKWVK